MGQPNERLWDSLIVNMLPVIEHSVKKKENVRFPGHGCILGTPEGPTQETFWMSRAQLCLEALSELDFFHQSTKDMIQHRFLGM